MAKGTETQTMVAALASGLERAGYGSMLTAGRRSYASLRPAIEAYAEFHRLRTDAPLETLVKHVLLPRCDRPDVDYEPDGSPMGQARPPEARTIERYLAGGLSGAEPRAGAAGPQVATIRFAYAAIPDAGDRFATPLAELDRIALAKYPEVCGLSWRIVAAGERANVAASSRPMGPGILGMAIVGPPGGITTVTDQWLRMNPWHAWDDRLYWTTLTHECGHSVGSGHRPGGIMGPVNTGTTEWSRADVEWLVRYYGPPGPAPEPPAPTPPPGPPGPPPKGRGTATFVGPDGLTIMVTGDYVRTS